MEAAGTKTQQGSHPGWHVVGAMLVACCGLSLYLLHMHITPPVGGIELVPGPPVLQEQKTVNWLGAYWNGRKIGRLRQVIERGEEGYSASGELELALSVGGQKLLMTSDLRITLESSGALKNVDVRMKGGPASGRLQIRAEGNMLRVEGELAGMKVKRRIPVTEPPVLDILVPRLLARQRLLPGQAYRAALFDPQTLSNRTVTYRVVGPEAVQTGLGLLPGIHVVAGGAFGKSDIWIDEEGNLLRQKTEAGLEFRAESAEAGSRPPAEPLDLSSSGIRKLVESMAPMVVGSGEGSGK